MMLRLSERTLRLLASFGDENARLLLPSLVGGAYIAVAFDGDVWIQGRGA